MNMSNATSARDKGIAAANVLGQLFADKRRRVRYGQAARNLMLNQLRAGKPVSGYRAEWIQQTSKKVAAVLRQAEAEFASTFIWDMVGAADFGDVLSTSHGLLVGDDASEEAEEAFALVSTSED